MTERKVVTVVVAEDARTEHGVLYAGTYQVEMPADYDPAAVTGEDILMDGAIRVVERA